MFTPSKLTEKDFFDATILNTPQPQATSTVQRKSTLESHYIHKDGNEAVYKQLITQNNDKSRKSDESSLGIINNISSLLAEVSAMEDKEKQNESKMDAEREIARRLLQRCSDLKPVSNIYDTNKENNANIQNLSPNTTSSTHVDQEQSSSFSQSNSRGESTLHASASKTNSVVFEPNEISARSSGLSRSSEKCRSSTSSKNVNAITFDTTTAELMAQFNNEEFHPASEMASRLLADEVSWQQNYSYALPTTTSAEKEYLNLSCFSGIIGELDLSVESCAGHKVSVDEFFRRKCGNFGELSDNAIARPSLGLSVTSPKKKGQLIPLVDSTMMTEESSVASYAVKDNPQQNIPNTTKDIEEQSIMSLTSIAQALQDIDNGTPRRLVDQLIMAKKKKKPVQVQEEIPPRDTYTLLPSNRKSMPATPSRNTENFEKDIKSANFSAKLSLDSKIATEMLDVKHSNARTLSFSSNSGAKTNFDAVCQELKKEISSESLPSSYSKDVVIGKNTEELCNCIVGMIRETDIELINKSDRWIICSLSVNQVQGDKHNVRLTLPKDVILIKPNSKQHAKITVTIVKMSKPIIAVLNITVSDMVTRYEWIMKHIICFKPEEFDISILNPPEKKDLDFQCVVENSITILPITIKNKNNVDVPIKFSLLQEEPSVFSLETLNESQYVMLKPQEVFTTNIKCKGILKQNTEAKQQSLQRHCGNLIIQAGNNSESIVTIGTVPLVVQVGTCKIQVIDTELPLVVPCKQSKPLTVINLGTTPVLISASFVQDNDSVKSLKYFSLQPENLLVQPNETGCFFITYKQQNSDNSKIYAKIKLTAANNVYHYSIIGESNPSTEAETDHLRCETPQYSSSASSPSSPHSITSNKSGNCGRNSPISTVSGSTVAGDKIPIRTTHAALVWSSIKTGKSDIKEFTIRNTSNNKIRIQAVISDSEKNFRFLRERQAVGTIVLILQGLESRTLSVVFGPHHLGAATGKIIFRHYEPRKEDESRPSKVLFLYGYGGYSKVEISEAFKDTSGKMWLSLGTLNSGGSLKAKIKLQNTGDLCSYAKIKLTPKAVYPTMVSSWQVNPSELLLSPKETQWVTLEFYPRKEDIALLQRSDVSHVGTILITHGDEPTRWRIRRLYNKMKETGELSGTGNEAFRNIIHPICIAFRGEQLISDVSAIRDSVQNLGDLCRGIRQHEILLTMEAYADETLSILHDNADESQMFYSLCSDNSHIYEGSGESFLPSETFIGNSTLQSDMNTDFMVHPSVIILTPPSKTEATVTVKSSCIVAQPFETCLSNTEYLSVVPAEGMIPTRRDFQLKIQCKRKIERNFDATLEIYTENNKFDVQIKVNVKRL
ncbi:spindle defective 2 isoform X4 [Megachile rotundata]|uniref:spindle defective 2 isoform X4 n=1 Tax=Megachile rotundata TaxID=143995 RepID=UPI003FD63A4B